MRMKVGDHASKESTQLGFWLLDLLLLLCFWFCSSSQLVLMEVPSFISIHSKLSFLEPISYLLSILKHECNFIYEEGASLNGLLSFILVFVFWQVDVHIGYCLLWGKLLHLQNAFSNVCSSALVSSLIFPLVLIIEISMSSLDHCSPFEDATDTIRKLLVKGLVM